MDDLLKSRKMKMTNLTLGDLYCDDKSPLSEVKHVLEIIVYIFVKGKKILSFIIMHFV